MHDGLRLAFGALLLVLPTAAPAQIEGALALELNKLEQVENACRAYLVIRNDTAADITSLDVDLVTFEPSGVIGSRFRIELAPVPATKTVVKSFDFEGVACDGVERVLLNDVVACTPHDRAACLETVELSSLAANFFK
jgi:hypothetical protein